MKGRVFHDGAYGQCRRRGGWILGHTPLRTAAGRPPTGQLVTHTFPLDHMAEAYDVFAGAADTGALKVVLGEKPHDDVAVRTA